MKIGFDQIRFGPIAPERDLASHVDAIIGSRRILQLASELAPDSNADADVDRYSNSIVAEYGRALRGPLQYIIRHSVIFDAATLPFEKDSIRRALLECAAEPSFGPEELASLGEMHFYLSYFILGMEDRKHETEATFLAEQRAEGVILRAEWLETTAHRRKSRMFRFLPTWVKSNA